MNAIRGILGLAGAALGLACADSALRADLDTPQPAFDFINGPATPGNSGVFRIAATDFLFAVHSEAGLIVIHGLQNTFVALVSRLDISHESHPPLLSQS